MAGIEKICEFSGKMPEEDGFPNCKMYDFKHNSIQILPKYRKLFRKVKDNHILYIFARIKNSVLKYENNESTYCLRVFDETLFGEVDGHYIGWTKELQTMQRKIKRLIKCKKLNAVKLKYTHEELFRILNEYADEIRRSTYSYKSIEHDILKNSCETKDEVYDYLNHILRYDDGLVYIKNEGYKDE